MKLLIKTLIAIVLAVPMAIGFIVGFIQIGYKASRILVDQVITRNMR